jgi:hypothetical protein
MQKYEPLAIVTNRVRRQHQAVKFTYIPVGTEVSTFTEKATYLAYQVQT